MWEVAGQGILPCAPVPPKPIIPLPSDGILGFLDLRLRPGAAGGWGRPFLLGGGFLAIDTLFSSASIAADGTKTVASLID